ncbi:MAG: ABC transporter [Tetragenococcus koreensis]|nr:ABC transporter [Tetragenococcus koreensis]MDN6670121.1 ABC transporter [Tetragenococcus koreensis]MDN6733439.1 ABC transporter [Tetragenococcus koreensis]
MGNTRLKELLKVNLRYANPQQTSKSRKKGKNGAALTRSLTMQYLSSGLLFLLVYGVAMLGLDFSQLPGYFTYYIALFGIIAFSQGISVIYNVFFESQDLPSFLPLPFRQNELFLAKIAVVSLTIMPFILPVFILFVLTGVQSNVFVLWSVLFAVVLFLLFLGLIFSICSFIVFGLTKTKLFKQHKQMMTSLLLIVSTVVAVLGILIMSWQSPQVGTTFTDRSTISFLLPFFYAASQPLRTEGLLSLLGLVVLLAGLIILFAKLLLPKLYEQLIDSSSNNRTAKRRHKVNQSLRQLLLHYNVQLIRNPSLLMQVFSNSILMPLIFTITFAFSGQIDLRMIGPQFAGVTFLGGVALASIMVNQTSFAANMISLDKENFSFIQSLPLSMKGYLQEKFHFAYLLQLALTSSVVVIMGLVLRMPLLHLISALCGGAVGTYLISLRYFSRDYRLLLLDWTEISQLFARGAGNLGLVTTMVGSVFLSVIVLVIYGFAVALLSPLGINMAVGAVFITGSFLWYRHYQKSFWEKLV